MATYSPRLITAAPGASGAGISKFLNNYFSTMQSIVNKTKGNSKGWKQRIKEEIAKARQDTEKRDKLYSRAGKLGFEHKEKGDYTLFYETDANGKQSQRAILQVGNSFRFVLFDYEKDEPIAIEDTKCKSFDAAVKQLEKHENGQPVKLRNGDGKLGDVDDDGNFEVSDEQDEPQGDESEERPDDAPDGSQQCKGTTQEGERCNNWTLNDNGYCDVHQDQAGRDASMRCADDFGYTHYWDDPYGSDDVVLETMERGGDTFDLEMECDGDLWDFYLYSWDTNERVMSGGGYASPRHILDSLIGDGYRIASRKAFKPKMRCAFINKQGKRCTRNASYGNYCWQHRQDKTASMDVFNRFINGDGEMVYSENVFGGGLEIVSVGGIYDGWYWRVKQGDEIIEEMSEDYEYSTPERALEDYLDSHGEVIMGAKTARHAGNFATAPRVPDEVDIDSSNVDACPLCGDPNFDGEFCNVCGYEEPPEGFDDIELETDEDYDEYEEDAESPDGDFGFDPDSVELDTELEEEADQRADKGRSDEDEYGDDDEDDDEDEFAFA